MKGCKQASNEASIKQKKSAKPYTSRLGCSYFHSELRLGNVLKMFLFFWQSEPQRSYKLGSYSKKSVYRTKKLL